MVGNKRNSIKKTNKDEIDNALLAYTLKVYSQNDFKERQLAHRIEEAKAKINIYLEADCPAPTDLKKNVWNSNG